MLDYQTQGTIVNKYGLAKKTSVRAELWEFDRRPSTWFARDYKVTGGTAATRSAARKLKQNKKTPEDWYIIDRVQGAVVR